MLYGRPVRELMREAARQLPSPTTPAEIVNWFAREYPLVKKTTVMAHIPHRRTEIRAGSRP
jgi:hypothetical protein